MHGLAAVIGLVSVIQQSPAPMTLREELRIGDETAPEYALANVTGLTRNPQGDYFVLQPMDRSVWKYDVRGRYKSKIGRGGAGPGEFGMPAAVGHSGGTLWVSDADLGRITLFDRDGKPTIITPRVELGLLRFVPSHLLADRSILSRPSYHLNLFAAGKVTSLPLLHLTVAGALDTIAVLPVIHKWWVVRNERRPAYGEGYGPQPFDDDPLVAVSPDGDDIVVVRRAASPKSAVLSITKHRYDGRLLWERQLAYTPVPLSAALVRRAIRKKAEYYGNGPLFATTADAERSLEKSIFRPAHLPSATQLVAGADGRIWIRRENAGMAAVRWLVLAADGSPEWEFSAPANLTIYYTNGSSASGVISNADEVQQLVTYTLRPAA